MAQVNRVLWHGDCLQTAALMERGSVDLVYFDPPFMTGKERHGTRQEFVFDDQWQGDLASFLPWLQKRIAAVIPLVSRHGSLIVHLDHRTIHYVKVWLDQHLGVKTFVNEIIWHYTGGGRSRSRFSCKHDTLLWYAPHGKPFFNPDPVRQPYLKTSGYARSGIRSANGKRYLPDPRGTPPDDVWNIPIINPMSSERVGWPTQKPLALLERLILALTEPQALVADFMCGSGTTLVAAAVHGRHWVGGDRSPEALRCAQTRLAACCKAQIEVLACDTMNDRKFPKEDDENV